MGIDIEYFNRNRYRQKMFRAHLQRQAERMSGRIGSFVSVDTLFFVLNDFSDEEIHRMVETLESEEGGGAVRLQIAVGKNEPGAMHLAGNYQKVCALLRLVKKGGTSSMFYDDAGVKKILLSVDDPSVLREYYEETLGSLERHDRENGTEYLALLQKYLEMDGSVQSLAEESFVHRNTINYQLGKIRKILGNDFASLKDRFRLILAFQIRELL